MDIARALLHLHPNAVPLKDFIIMDLSDGKGPFISEWNLEDPEPTAEELLTVWEEIKDIPTVIPKTEIEILTEKNEQLEKELAITKEDSIANMLAITEIYEMMLGGGT
jgi:XkdW protein